MRATLGHLLLSITLIVLAAAGVRAQPAPSSNAPRVLDGILVGMPSPQSFAVRFFGAPTDTVLRPADRAVLDMLGKAAPGDGLTLRVDDAAAPTTIEAVVAVQSRRGFVAVCLYLLAALAILLAFGLLATRNRPQLLVIGADNRYSMSKFQMAAWFFVLFMVYIASILVLLTQGWVDYLGKIEIPQNLVILSGLSALTYGAAKVITVSKVEDAKAGSAAPAGPPRTPPTESWP